MYIWVLCTAHGNSRAISRSAYKKEICTILNPRNFAAQRSAAQRWSCLPLCLFYDFRSLFFFFLCLESTYHTEPVCVCVCIGVYLVYICIMYLHTPTRGTKEIWRILCRPTIRPRRPLMQSHLFSVRLACIPCKFKRRMAMVKRQLNLFLFHIYYWNISNYY